MTAAIPNLNQLEVLAKQVSKLLYTNSRSILKMVAVTISAAGRPPNIARGLPYTVEFAQSFEQVTVGDVKAALVTKFPKVRV